MVNSGVCCASLKDSKALMKMGLGLVLVGHVNFLLGALVHGAVLRYVNVHPHPRRIRAYAVANVISLSAGLVGIIAGIAAIVLSKNKKNKIMMWFLLVVSFLAGLLALASIVGLFWAMVRAILHRGQSLLVHCKFPDAIGYSSITNECPFDPTRIYGTTVILWVPLILMCVVEVVFSGRCFAVCTFFLRFCRKKAVNAKKVRIGRSVEMSSSPPELEPEMPEPEAQPAEQHELLGPDSPNELSDWV
ncbi:transmembrane protein 54a isoform X1 [Osmerus eperlanus]|uniref:transmembrane protein 54a isoform X1 n=2 Tax=Osmerus eperlanus TaxID=29151 RepID=UPI002E109389